MSRNGFALPTEEPDLEPVDDDDEEEEEEEDDTGDPPDGDDDVDGGDDGPASPPPAAAAPPPASAPAPRAPRRKKNRRGAAAGPPRSPFDVSTPEAATWKGRADWPKELEALWPVVLACTATEFHIDASQIAVQVIQLSGGVGQRVVYLEPKLRGDQLIGNEQCPSGQFIKNFIIDYVHGVNTRGPGSYRVRFTFANGGYICESQAFDLEAIEVIRMRRQHLEAAQQQAEQAQNYTGMGAGAPPPQYGAPPPRQQPQHAPYGYGPGYPQPSYDPRYDPRYASPAPPYGYGPPPGYGQQPQSPQGPPQAQPGAIDAGQVVNRLIEERSTMYAEMNAMRNELAKQRGEPAPAPVQPPPPPPIPVVPQHVDEESVARRVVSMLQPILGAGLGAAAQAAPGSGFAGRIQAGFERMVIGAIESTIKETEANLAGRRSGAPAAAPAPVAPPPAVAPTEPPPAAAIVEDPTDRLPFDQIETKGKWPDGSIVYFTPPRDGETGFAGVHPLGFLSNNPFAAMKALEIVGASVNKLADTASDAVKQVMSGQKAPAPQEGAAQVVDRTPPGAVDANDPNAPPPPPPRSGW